MNQSDMMPKVNIMDYVPPLTKPQHQVEPLMNNLIETEKAFHESTQNMMQQMQQMAAGTMMKMKQPGAMAFLPNGG